MALVVGKNGQGIKSSQGIDRWSPISSSALTFASPYERDNGRRSCWIAFRVFLNTIMVVFRKIPFSRASSIRPTG